MRSDFVDESQQSSPNNVGGMAFERPSIPLAVRCSTASGIDTLAMSFDMALGETK
jgi:hypothetical protein